MVKGNAAIEIFMKDKFIFPYNYLEDAKTELKIPDKYNIYYVLKGHKFKIESINRKSKYDYNIVIYDMVEKSSSEMLFNVYMALGIQDVNCVELKTVENDAVLQINLTNNKCNYTKNM